MAQPRWEIEHERKRAHAAGFAQGFGAALAVVACLLTAVALLAR